MDATSTNDGNNNAFSIHNFKRFNGIASSVDNAAVHTASTADLDDTDYLAIFQDWCTSLETKLKESLPNVDTNDTFKYSCSAIVEADADRIAAVKKRDDIAKQIPIDQDALDKANADIAKAEECLKSKIDSTQDIAKSILDGTDFVNFLDTDFDDTDLITFTILNESTPEKLAKWCNDNTQQADELIGFLKDKQLSKLFVQSGGARNGEYPTAVQIYNKITPCETNPVLYRLALAVALELASPYKYFDTPDIFIDPYQRYIHFEQAYLLGELDPNFCRFNVSEIRHVVNCDATEEELGWGRQCLLNYQPDIAYSDNPQWQYCFIVRTDVSYNDPVWYKDVHSYDQILSGGGKCGPRAWYGRFICKLFGIPTWGVVQPGHAAMARWTINGWCVCLRAGFQYSDWEGECGLYFQLTTQAMQSCRSEEMYTSKVRRLLWMAALHKESSSSVRSNFLPHPNTLWWSLAFFQQNNLVAMNTKTNVFMHNPVDQLHNFLQRIKLSSNACYADNQMKQVSNQIIIPACACSNPQQTTQDVRFMSSFSSGQQLFISGGGSVEYTIKPPILTNVLTTYNLICVLCTVHRKAMPLTVLVCSNGTDGEPILLNLPYTNGMWTETDSVTITIDGNDVNHISIKIVRSSEMFGFSLKQIVLEPI